MRYILVITVVVGFFGLLSSCLQKVDNFDDLNQFKKDTAAIDSYILSNFISGTKLPSGIWYEIDSASTGIRPAFKDTMILTYKLRLLSDNSVVEEVDVPSIKLLSDQLPGVQIAMPYFQNGSRGKIYIPSYYGYKNASTGAIPANSNLIFEFKLKGVKDAQLKADTTAIDKFLANTAHVLKDPSGLRYVIDSLGQGSLQPQANDSIVFKYGLKLFTGGQVTPYTTTPSEALLSDLILAWQIALPKIPEGSYITLYVPSSLGYGPNQQTAIPANSILVYNIKLLKVIDK